MNCEELRENTAAYALGALTGSEQQEFEQHMIECDLEHDVESFNDVMLSLSNAVPSVEPPAGLRDRILNAAAADQESRQSSSQQASPQRRSAQSWIQRIQRFGAPAYGAAAAMLLVIGALVGWGVASVSSGNSATELSHFRRDPEGDWLRVETTLGENGLMLSVGNLDTLPSQNTYQFWAIREERWVPIGDFNTNVERKWSGYFEFSLEKGDSVAITVEPEPGSESPSSDPEIQSRI